jgi:hypothetical protein
MKKMEGVNFFKNNFNIHMNNEGKKTLSILGLKSNHIRIISI